MYFVIWLGALSTILTGSTVTSARWLTTSQKLSQDVDLAQFNGLLRENNLAKLSLLYQEVTVFAPTDEAFSRYYTKWLEEMVLYHLVLKSLSLGDLKQNSTSKLHVLIQECPPLWITNTADGRTFVNDAMIVEDKSNYIAKNRADKHGKNQVLHVIDSVLYPYSELNVSKNTAYDFLQDTYKYNLGGNRHTTNKFLDKVDSANQAHLFKTNVSFTTFFIPIDQLMTDEQHLSLDKDLIRAHIVPHKVLFSRPTVKGEVFASAANDDYLTVLVSLYEDSNSRLMVKSRTLYGNSNHPIGEMEAQIVVRNIPVENGVVHLIDKPIGVFRQKLPKFPWLSIATKVTNDLQLNITYTLAQTTGIFDILEDDASRYTFFAPTDKAWKEFSLEHSFKLSNIFNQSFLSTARSILLRHLVPGAALSLDTIVANSVTVPVKLRTMLGEDLVLSAHKIKDKYYVNWIGNGRMTGVSRADYECSNGIVHVLDMPLMLYNETETLFEQGKMGDLLLVTWRVLKRLLL